MTRGYGPAGSQGGAIGTLADRETARPRESARTRIAGVDLARALAILGMFAVHVGPTDAGGLAGRLYAAPHGRAAILFGLVAGVGVSLLAGSRTASPARARLVLAWRVALLLPAGLALQLLDHGVFVILQDYALLFLLGILVVGLADRWLLVLAGASVLLGPTGYLWGLIHGSFSREPIELTDGVGEILHGLVLSGPYPLITWAAPFLVGMWLGRRDLRARLVRVRLLLVGGGIAVLALLASVGLAALLGDPGGAPSWLRIVSHEPHSQMPLWLLGATGSAAFVLGGSLVVAEAARRVAWPLVATGQLALTVYVGHLLALHLAPEALKADEVGGAAALVAGFAAASAVAAVAWRAVFARGPLEVVLRPPSRLVRPAVTPAPARPRAGGG